VLWHMAFDTWFYWSHRAFHSKLLYKRVHKPVRFLQSTVSD